MSTKPVGYHHPPATQQNFGGNFERSSDRLAPSNKKVTVNCNRAAVGGLVASPLIINDLKFLL